MSCGPAVLGVEWDTRAEGKIRNGFYIRVSGGELAVMASAKTIDRGRKRHLAIASLGALASLAALVTVATRSVTVDPVLLSVLVAVFSAGAVFAAVFALSPIFRNRASSEMHSLSQALDALASSDASQIRALRDLRLPVSLEKGLQSLSSSIEVNRATIVDLQTSNCLLARDHRQVLQCLESLRDGIILIDPEGRIQFANKAASPFLRVSEEDARGNSVMECTSIPEIRNLFEQGVDRVGSKGTESIEIEADIRCSYEHTLMTSTHIMDSESGRGGKALVFQEISRMKSVERLQAQFVDSVAHELRSPLTSIRAYAELLVDGGDSIDKQTQHDFFNVIYEETYRLSQLIDNLLNISMMDSGAARLEITPTRIKRLLEESAEVIRVQCEKKGIDLNVDLDDRLPTLDIDKSLFGMAVQNLLSNAVKYTPEGGKIRLSTSSQEEEFRIEVKDTGIGIAEDELDQVFEKFYRASSAESVHGSGIGLSTARAIVRLHGGDVEAVSKLGEGSTFSIVLPRSLINQSIGE